MLPLLCTVKRYIMIRTSCPEMQNDPVVPRLYLDVDGVLNAFGFELDLASFDDFELHEVVVDTNDGFNLSLRLHLSRTMGEQIGSLGAEIVWATTWEHNADTMIVPLCGLPRGLAVLERPPDAAPGGGWKFDVVRQAVADDGRPFVWIDDDLDTFGDDRLTPRRWAADLPVQCLLIAPNPRAGLTHGQLEAVGEFIDRMEGSA
jgi:hypothetical protein